MSLFPHSPPPDRIHSLIGSAIGHKNPSSAHGGAACGALGGVRWAPMGNSKQGSSIGCPEGWWVRYPVVETTGLFVETTAEAVFHATRERSAGGLTPTGTARRRSAVAAAGNLRTGDREHDSTEHHDEAQQ